MSNIKDNLGKVEQQIKNACQINQKSPTSVQLLAVSKTKPASDVESAYNAGQRLFGENYVQEAVDKINELEHLDEIQWYFIGPIQSNKTRPIASHFHWVETVCRDKIAQRLNDQRPDDMPPLNVLLQINISGEEQKAGIGPAEAKALAELVDELPNLALRGLMCIPENTEDEQALADQFEQMKALFQQLQQQYSQLDTLSMGMSADMALAVEHGSTEVRIGTDIFGARS